LMISPDPLSQEDVMERLNISRGNVNMNIRDLVGWGLVDRVLKSGERKEYFSAEKDIWKVATQIVKERKKRELDPMLKLLDQLEDVEGDRKENLAAYITPTLPISEELITAISAFVKKK